MKSLEKKSKVRISEILDKLKVGESYCNTKRFRINQESKIEMDLIWFNQSRRKTEYLRTTCIGRMKKTQDVYDVTTFVSFNTTHTEIIFGSVATKIKIGENNPYFTNEEREVENQKPAFATM